MIYKKADNFRQRRFYSRHYLSFLRSYSVLIKCYNEVLYNYFLVVLHLVFLKEYSVWTVRQSVARHPGTRVLASLCSNFLNFDVFTEVHLKPLINIICSRTPGPVSSRSRVRVQSCRIRSAGRAGGHHGCVRNLTTLQSQG